MLPLNPYLLLFRSLVLNHSLKELAPFIIEEQAKIPFWDFLAWNRLTPLLYRTIRKQKAEAYFSDSFMTKLTQLHQRGVAKSLQMEMVLKEILPHLEKENIKPILLKGVALAFSVYDNPALRPMLDIDMLFAGGQEKHARDILLSLGGEETYAEESPHTTGLWQHIPPIKFKNVIIELHNHIAASYDPGFLPLEQIIKNPGSITIGDHYCLVFRSEMQVYHLLSHMHKHVLAGYSRLIWLADLHLYIGQHGHTIDWQNFRTLAENTGLAAPFEKYLQLLNTLLTTGLPLELKDNPYAEEFLKICRKTVPGEKQIGTLDMMGKLTTTRQRILFLRGKLFPSVEYVKKKYNVKSRTAAVLYYPLVYIQYFRKIFK